MSSFYIETESGVLYTLDATTDISEEVSVRVTQFPVEDGTNISDNAVVNNITASFSGIITDIKLAASIGRLGTEDYIRGIKNLINSKRPFTIHFDNKMDALDTCLFTSFSPSKNSARSTGYDITFSVTQIRVAQRAGAVIGLIHEDYANQGAAKKDGGSATTDEVELPPSFARSVVDTISETFAGSDTEEEGG